MRLELIVLLALSWCVTSRDNDDDEGRPYEFGFTIDGQQHRHESKDVNGIIMGEFGFITADGVYHVTVYATDENGSFKILSMKNVKISEPLDQPGFEFPARTPTGFMMPIPAGPVAPALPPITTTTTQRPQAPYDFTTVPSLNVASCSSCKLPSTTQRAPGAPNGLPFQTPAFQNPPKINGNQQIIIQNGAQPPNQPANNLPSFPAHNKYPPIDHLPLGNPPTGTLPIFPPNNQVPFTGNTVPSTNGGFPQQPLVEQQPPFGNSGDTVQPARENHNIPPGKVSTSPFMPGPPAISPNYPISGGQPPFTSVDHKPPPQPTRENHNIPPGMVPTSPFIPGPPPISPNYPISGGQPPFTSVDHKPPPQPTRENHNIPPGKVPTSPFIPGPPPISPNYPISGGQPPFSSVNHKPSPPPKSPITVSNQQINIPGRDPIPIKDPYPNMVAGLPNGITENDMLDILYKFNYTLGFHGHHEKGLKNGTKIGAYFVNGRDGISRVVEYIADENGYRPKFKFVNLGLDSADTPKEGSEKKFGLKGFEFVWFPI